MVAVKKKTRLPCSKDPRHAGETEAVKQEVVFRGKLKKTFRATAGKIRKLERVF